MIRGNSKADSPAADVEQNLKFDAQVLHHSHSFKAFFYFLNVLSFKNIT